MGICHYPTIKQWVWCQNVIAHRTGQNRKTVLVTLKYCRTLTYYWWSYFTWIQERTKLSMFLLATQPLLKLGREVLLWGKVTQKGETQSWALEEFQALTLISLFTFLPQDTNNMRPNNQSYVIMQNTRLFYSAFKLFWIYKQLARFIKWKEPVFVFWKIYTHNTFRFMFSACCQNTSLCFACYYTQGTAKCFHFQQMKNCYLPLAWPVLFVAPQLFTATH